MGVHLALTGRSTGLSRVHTFYEHTIGYPEHTGFLRENIYFATEVTTESQPAVVKSSAARKRLTLGISCPPDAYQQLETDSLSGAMNPMGSV